MLKKALFVVVGFSIIGGLMFGSKLPHLVGDLYSNARNMGDQLVSVDAKIGHARKDIKALDKDVRKLMHDIAKEEVKCEDLREEVSKKSQALSKLHIHMEVLNDHLNTGSSQHFVATNGKNYTGVQVKQDLATSLKQYKTNQTMLDAMEKQLDSRVAILETAQEKLEETKRAKAELFGELEALEAEHRMNEVAKMTSEFKLDDSRLSKAKEAIKKLRSEIRVEGSLVNQISTSGQIPTVPTETDNLDDITVQYEAFFGKTSAVASK
jgi:chromosome segregation ATPase